MSLLVDILIWVAIALLCFIFILLLSLYIRGAFRWRPLLHIEHAIAPDDPRFARTLKGLSESLSAQGTIIGFWNDISSIQQARLDAIISAEHSIQFETFMMTPGRRAQDFASAIARKAAEGVQVQLLVDTFGTHSLPSKYWNKLRKSGAQVVFFNPFDWRAPANFAGRTHRKLLIIDDKKAFIGGAGISDLWDGTEKSDDTQPWLDVEFALTGDCVSVLSALFQKHWQGHRLGDSTPTIIDMDKIYVPNPEADKQNDDIAPAINIDANKPSTILITPGTRPTYRDSSIEILKQILIASARKRLWLASPYFLPNKSTRRLLIEAKKSGVDVRILTTSDRSDKKSVYYASYEVYGPLLEAGVQIFEYAPSMTHAKMMIVDHNWVNTGSANIDYRSFLHNDELDIITDSPDLFDKIEQVFQKGFDNSEQIGLKQWQQRSLLKHRLLGNTVRLVQWQL